MEKQTQSHKADFFRFIESIKHDRTEDTVFTTTDGETYVVSGPESTTKTIREFLANQ